MPTQKIDPKVIFASDAPAIDKPPVFSDKTKGMDVTRRNDGRPEIKELNKLFQDTDLKILWLNENAVLPYDASIDYPDGVVTLKDGSFKQLSSGSWVEFLDDFADKDAVKRGIANRYDSSLTYNSGERVVLANGDIAKSTVDGNTNDPNVNMTGWELQGNKSVATPNDLTSIQNPKDGQVAYVESLQKNYIYNSANTYAPNSVTVVGKWEMQLQDVYYASWFATPDVTTDQSVKLQAGHDYAVYKNNKPFIVDGVFHVEANQEYLSIANSAFIVRDYSKITFLPNAKFIQINQNKNQSNIVLLMRTKGATLIRPTLVGDRLTNTFLAPSSDAQGYGYGLTLYEPEDCFIFEPNCSQNHGDNIYIGKSWGSNVVSLPKNITIVRPIVHHARRNCISLTAWDNVKIIDPIMSYGGDSDGITGAFPKSCLDVELEEAEGFPIAQGFKGLITNPQLLNSSNGLFFYCSGNGRSFDINITGVSTFSGINTIAVGAYYGGSNCTGKVYIENVDIEGSPYIDFSVGWHKSSLQLVIDKLETRRGSLTISSLMNGSYATNILGNVSINNLITRSNSSFIYDVGGNKTIDGYKFHSPEGSLGIGIYSNDVATQAKFGKDTFIESKDLYTYVDFSNNTLKMPNTIWQRPPDDTTAVYLDTANDFRTLKIGLSASGRVGQGCNIQGLNLLIGGVAKTTMRTLTLGGWVKFKNVSGGRTQILDMFGDWTYG